MTAQVSIIGGGLAGSEAAMFLANRGIQVSLQEMRPMLMTEAHQTDHFGELVCSNSFKTTDPDSGPGLLKAEMAAWGSLALDGAGSGPVDGGMDVAVDRTSCGALVTRH